MARPQVRLVIFAIALALGAAGCFNPFDPLVATQRAASTPPPAPNSSTNVIRLFAWCWQNRDPSLYAEIFTADYSFQFAAADSAGIAFRDAPWVRENELSSAQHLFTGGSDQPPASDISITIDNGLIAQPDTRAGKDPRWHKSVRTHVDLKVTIEHDGQPSINAVTGYAHFYVVRGDSANIPPDLAGLGFKPDSTRWWIERWEDETLTTAGSPQASLRPAGPAGRRPASPMYPLPPGVVTFGTLKDSYLNSN